MLEQKEYSRKELFALYSTNRMDSIKRKLKAQGYIYTESGKGNNYILSIDKLPPLRKQLEILCIDEIGFSPQTDFTNAIPFVYLCFTDDIFLNLQNDEKQYFLSDLGINLSVQAISRYLQKVKSLLYEDNREFIYYRYDKEKEENIYISKEEYNNIYKTFWQLRKAGQYGKAELYLYGNYGRYIPKKRKKKMKTAFCNDIYNRFIELYEEYERNEEIEYRILP